VSGGMKPIPHGTRNGYSHYGCRCDECSEANSEWRKAQRARWRAAGCAPGKAPPRSTAVPHGTISGYTYWNCRCEPCARAMRADTAKRQAANNAEALQKASRHGREWTVPEMEVASRADLTARQAAELLGRSVYSVQNMRVAMKRVDAPGGAGEAQEARQ